MPKQSAFTIIELLVVVSIIAILAALLLPAVGLVRTSARQAVCANHMRQAFMAIHAYAQDWDGTSPYCYDRNTDETWVHAVDPEAKARALAAGPEGQPAPTSRFGIFNCPENRAQTWLSGLGVTPAHGSYSANSRTAAQDPWDGRYFGGQLSRFRHVGELLVLFDGIAVGSEPWYEDGAQTVPYTLMSMRGVHYRHARRTNLLFADGHTGSTGLLRGRGAPQRPTGSPVRAGDFTNGRAWWVLD